MSAIHTPRSVLPPADPFYPDSDGKRMADNTEQFQWIMTIVGNLSGRYRDDPNVVVVGDLLWYPEEGRSDISTAPDAYIIFGRPKVPRRSYQQWRENGIAPQVVFELLSASNRPDEMQEKLEFYDRYGVEEYYLYDPSTNELSVWIRQDGRLQAVAIGESWVSPRLQIRFDLSGPKMVIFHDNGKAFASFEELMRQQELEQKEKELAQRAAARERRAKEREQRAKEREQHAREQAEQAAERERQEKVLAQKEKQQAEQAAERERHRAEQMAAKLRALGIDPEA